jgi:hypothetical protein
VSLNTSTGGAIHFSPTPINTGVGGFTYVIGSLGDVPKFDFTGDGQGDLLAEYSYPDPLGGPNHNSFLVLHYTGGTFSSWVLAANVVWGGVIDVRDFNGDGCMDLVWPTGITVSPCNGSTPVGFAFNAGDVPLAVINWDGGAHPAVVVNHGGNLGVYKWVGTGLSTVIPTTISASGNVFGMPNAIGDGLDALISIPNGLTAGPIQYYLHNGAGQPPDLLTSVTDGYLNFVKPS